MSRGPVTSTARGRIPYAFAIVAACIVIVDVPMGLIYGCSGLFFTPVSQQLGVSRTAFTLYFSIHNLLITCGLPLFGRMVDRIDIRVTGTVCGTLVACAFLGMSRSSELWQFYLCGALLGVSVIPFCYFIIPKLVTAWFAERVGFFMGICTSCMGISGIIFSPILAQIIDSGAEGWRTGYLVMAVVILAATVPAMLLVIKPTPKSVGLAPYGVAKSEARTTDSSGLTAAQAVRTKAFWGLVAFNGLAMFAGTILQFIPSYTQSLAETIPTVAAQTGTITSVALAGQTLGMLTLGAVDDRSLKLGLGCGLAAAVVGMGLLWLFPSQLALVYVGALVFGVCYSSAGVLNPLLPREVFGTRDVSAIYARTSMAGSVASTFSTVLWSAAAGSSLGFPLVFALGICCMLVATCGGWFALARKPRA